MENGAIFLPLMDLVLEKARIAPLQREGGRQSLCANYKGRLISRPVSMENGAAFLPLMDLVLDKARIAPLQREGG